MGRNPQSQLKRAREQALKERRERKRARKAARDASRSAPTEHELPPAEDLVEAQDVVVEPPGHPTDVGEEIPT